MAANGMPVDPLNPRPQKPWEQTVEITPAVGGGVVMAIDGRYMGEFQNGRIALEWAGAILSATWRAENRIRRPVA